MTLTQDDIRQYKSSVAGSGGGSRSGVQITSAKNSIFDDIGDTQRIAGGTVIKKWFLANDNAAEAWILPVVWIATVPLGCTEELGFGWDDAEDDDNTQGNMVSWSANSKLTVQSDGTDLRTVEVYGKNATGDAAREVIALNGTSAVQSVTKRVSPSLR